ncbi:hypothetical protein BJX99DRAFT_266874 [Aspergillus californicus]
MPVLTTSDFAVTSSGTTIYVYYQQDHSLIETTSDDGKTWAKSSGEVASDLNPDGSPFTAYYVRHDGTAGGNPSVHVIYVDKEGHLVELVKQPVSGNKWTKRDLAAVTHKPVNTSKLTSAVCHDSAPGAHQWFFFEESNETSTPQIAEYRSGSESNWSWRYQAVLPEKSGTALPGTQLACYMSNPTTHLFFQTHSGNILECLGGYADWTSSKEILTADKVEISTPLVAVASNEVDKPYVFYVDKAATHMIQVYKDGKSTPVTKHMPGTRLGAGVLNSEVYLIHRRVEDTSGIYASSYDGNKWHVAEAKVN